MEGGEGEDLERGEGADDEEYERTSPSPSAKALSPLYPLSTLLSHTGTRAIACKIRRKFISVETEVLLANLITLSQTKHKLCPSRVDALAWPSF